MSRNSLKSSLFTVTFILLAILPTILYLYIDDSIKSYIPAIPNLKPVTTKPVMDSSVIVALLTTVGLILTTIYNPTVNSKFKALNEKFDIAIARLQAVEKITERYSIQTNVVQALQSIASDSLVYCSNEALADFVNREANNIITFASYVNSTGFSNITEKDICTKVRSVRTSGLSSSNANFGKEFSATFESSYSASLSQYKDSIFKIKSDYKTNNKDARFRALSETFLHDHISLIINYYHNANTKSNSTASSHS